MKMGVVPMRVFRLDMGESEMLKRGALDLQAPDRAYMVRTRLLPRVCLYICMYLFPSSFFLLSLFFSFSLFRYLLSFLYIYIYIYMCVCVCIFIYLLLCDRSNFYFLLYFPHNHLTRFLLPFSSIDTPSPPTITHLARISTARLPF